MGYDIDAYFDIDQSEVEKWITENGIDRSDWKQSDLIVDHCKQQFSLPYKLLMYYHWNEECQIHELYASYRTNFIRDDKRFQNRRFHKVLEAKLGRPFPSCLDDINYYVRTSKDAIEVAMELAFFFGHDQDLMDFAKWLLTTAKYCSTYELDW